MLNRSDDAMLGLVLRYLDGELSAEQAQTLNDEITAAPASAKRFAEMVQLACLVREQAKRAEGICNKLSIANDQETDYNDVLQELLRLEQDAQVLPAIDEQYPPTPHATQKPVDTLQWRDAADVTVYLLGKAIKTKPAIYAAAAAVVLLVAVALVPWGVTPPPQTAQEDTTPEPSTHKPHPWLPR